MVRHANYGYDAPYALIAFAGAGTLLTLATIAALASHATAMALSTAPYGAFFLANAASFFYTSLKGIFHAWHPLLDERRLRGDEQVLDMGCGRGAVLIAVAHRLT